MNETNPTLVRSQDRILGGVCGGIAERFGWDKTVVRVVFALLTILSTAFPGILLYLILWVVMPPATGG